MNKQNYLYGVIGLLAGLIIGYLVTDAINRNAPQPSTATTAAGEPAVPPNHPPAGDSGGNASAQGDGPQADVMAAIQQARNEPSNFDAQMKAAALFKQIGRAEGALEFYERAAKIKPNDSGVLTALGDANFDLKRYDKAETWYRAALKIIPNDATVWMDLGSSYYLRQPRSAEDLTQAIAAYRSALKADPRHEKSLQNLTRALLDKGDKSAARDILKQLEQVNPGNPSLAQFRAELN